MLGGLESLISAYLTPEGLAVGSAMRGAFVEARGLHTRQKKPLGPGQLGREHQHRRASAGDKEHSLSWRLASAAWAL